MGSLRLIADAKELPDLSTCSGWIVSQFECAAAQTLRPTHNERVYLIASLNLHLQRMHCYIRVFAGGNGALMYTKLRLRRPHRPQCSQRWHWAYGPSSATAASPAASLLETSMSPLADL
jgi:hypothetical protein